MQYIISSHITILEVKTAHIVQHVLQLCDYSHQLIFRNEALSLKILSTDHFYVKNSNK